MSEEAKGRVLDFLSARNKALLEETQIPPTPGARPLHFAVHALSREEQVLMTRPLFELILMHLWKGDDEAKTLAHMLQQTTNITVPPWPV